MKQLYLTNKGVVKIPDCIQDVVSSLYYVRNIDFRSYKANDKIRFTMFLGNQIHNMSVKFAGREIVKTRYGKFRAFKLKLLIVKTNTFKDGEEMSVWMSDDANHIPLRVETPIRVGSIKVDMMLYRNLRYPLTSLIRN